MRFGAQVRQTGGLLAALGRGEAMGAQVLQLFAQSTRQWRPPDPAEEPLLAFRRAAASSAVVTATVCHAPYLINLISPDPLTAERSRTSLAANLRAATLMGARGLVLHPGSHRGVGADTAVARIAERAVAVLDEVQQGLGVVCDLLLENTAGGGGTIGRSFGELGAMIEAAGDDERLGVCLDTQHLWASGVSYASDEEADAVLSQLADEIGLERLRCLHLNDSKVALGAGSDRHANLGQGTIGARALGSLLASPFLARLPELPVVLEVPGLRGSGPGRADLDSARAILAAGLAARKQRA